jgi:hypothetical protein
VISPEMVLPLAAVPLAPPAGLPLPDEGAAAGEAEGGEDDDDALAPADELPPADGAPDELQAARADASSTPAAAARPLATAGRRIRRTAETAGGDGMEEV